VGKTVSTDFFMGRYLIILLEFNTWNRILNTHLHPNSAPDPQPCVPKQIIIFFTCKDPETARQWCGKAFVIYVDADLGPVNFF
jgi:hypothetical protein